MKLFAVADFQELINYDIVLNDAGTPFLGTSFPELRITHPTHEVHSLTIGCLAYVV